MEYIKIKKGKNIYFEKTKKHYYYIENELITKKELKKQQQQTMKNILNLIEFENININKNKTCFVFGSRQLKTN